MIQTVRERVRADALADKSGVNGVMYGRLADRYERYMAGGMEDKELVLDKEFYCMLAVVSERKVEKMMASHFPNGDRDEMLAEACRRVLKRVEEGGLQRGARLEMSKRLNSFVHTAVGYTVLDALRSARKRGYFSLGDQHILREMRNDRTYRFFSTDGESPESRLTRLHRVQRMVDGGRRLLRGHPLTCERHGQWLVPAIWAAMSGSSSVFGRLECRRQVFMSVVTGWMERELAPASD